MFQRKPMTLAMAAMNMECQQRAIDFNSHALKSNRFSNSVFSLPSPRICGIYWHATSIVTVCTDCVSGADWFSCCITSLASFQGHSHVQVWLLAVSRIKALLLYKAVNVNLVASIVNFQQVVWIHQCQCTQLFPPSPLLDPMTSVELT